MSVTGGERIYLDHNATTPLRAEAREVLQEALDEGLGNPSSVHAAGRRARAVIDESRERVAAALGVAEDDVLFTSGGTESNNLALLGCVDAVSGTRAGRLHLITTAIEHAAVQAPAAHLERQGTPVTLVGPDERGVIDLGALADRSRESQKGSTRPLVSVMAANNEVGSTVDLVAVREAVGDAALLHTDAVQALGKLPLVLEEARIDLASFSAHKVGGPVGVGILTRRSGTPISARVLGGAQEAELRPGTENVAGIAAAACAVELAVRETKDFATRTRSLATELWEGILAALPGAQLNGPPIDDPTRLPNTINVSMPSGDARTLVARLDLAGLEVSAGSACASGSIEPSHVLMAMGIDRIRAVSGVRMSLGRTTSRVDIHSAVDKLRTTLGNPT